MRFLVILFVVLAAGWSGCSHRVVQQTGDSSQLSTFKVALALGMNRLLAGRLSESEHHFRQAERAAHGDTEKAQVKAGLGGLEVARGNHGKAEKLALQALELDSETAEGWLVLARIRVQQGDTLAAIAVLGEGRLETPARPDVEAELGLLQMKRGAFVQAVLHLERALQKQPQRTDWQQALDTARIEAGVPPPRAVAVTPARQNEDDGIVEIREAQDKRVPDGLTNKPTDPDTIVIAPVDSPPGAEKRLRRRADEIIESKQMTRADLAVLLTMEGPVIEPWPGLGDLPKDVRKIAESQAVAVVLFAGWMQRFPDGLFYPDDRLNRTQTVILIERQVQRYPALVRKTRQGAVEINDISPRHYAYPAIVSVVASGLLELDGDGRFRPEAPLTGRDGLHLVRWLARAVAAGVGGSMDEVPPRDGVGSAP